MIQAIETTGWRSSPTDGWCEVSDRTLIGMTGKDRQRLLHGFCTADIEKLPVGATTEAFILNGKGKTIGFIRVHADQDRLLLDADPQQFEPIVQHLDRYVIREDVQFSDLSDELRRIVLCGAAVDVVDAWLNQPASTHVGEDPFHVDAIGAWDIDWLYPRSRLVVGTHQQVQPLVTRLGESCGAELSASDLEVLRIRQGAPAVGREVTDDVLPQELRRNERAISFTKGCYLGQETVARIDALGHVNRFLVGLMVTGIEAPPAGTPLMLEGKDMGILTSVSDSDADGVRIGLGFVRRARALPGSALQCGSATVTVIDLPIAGPSS